LTYNIFVNFQLQLEKNYDAAVADGSDESSASTRAVAETFEHVTRLRCTWMFPESPGPVKGSLHSPAWAGVWGHETGVWGHEAAVGDWPTEEYQSWGCSERRSCSWPRLQRVNKVPDNLGGRQY